jgi:hypothetical protein
MGFAIWNKGSNQRLMDITEAQRDQLIDALEEEDSQDHDYYIDSAVCDFLDGKVDAAVVARLREALGKPKSAAAAGEEVEAAGDDELPPEGYDEEEGIEIEWRED